jgi:hypothetical protein
MQRQKSFNKVAQTFYLRGQHWLHQHRRAFMESIEKRIEIAEQKWAQGKSAEDAGDFHVAYNHYTFAHDTIMDCARLHQRAHEYLRRINWKMGNYGELVTDWLLHLFAPLGVFELVSYLSKTGTFGSLICKRTAL